MTRALVFDFDGLILDTETALHISINEVLAPLGLHLAREDWQELVGTVGMSWIDLTEQRLGVRWTESERLSVRHSAQRGLRFCEKAVIPSTPSSLANRAADISEVQ